MIYKPGEQGDEVIEYNEFSVADGAYGLQIGVEFMKLFIGE